MNIRNWRRAYLRLHPKAALKKLEQQFIYHITNDELYEIDEKAVGFFLRCDGTARGEELSSESDFVEYCLEEELLEALPDPNHVDVSVNMNVAPSLRYLELQLTNKCNLRCAHCYLGSPGSGEMILSDAVNITQAFADMGGIRLLISGGEPLLYKNLKEYIARTQNTGVRRVLFSNGTLIDSGNISWLNVDEIQFSLDGWRKGHEALRGSGTFEKTIAGIRMACQAGTAVSVSTMIHRENLDEFERMKDFIRDIGAVEWGVDVMSVSGALEAHRELVVSNKEAVPFLDYAFGGGYHGASEGYACGRHLMTIMPDCRAVKCGFYRDKPIGDARIGLKECWLKMEHIPLSRLECSSCSALDECRGGCRFRAPDPLAPDPVMCCYYGISG
ncbi:MAG: radical SAM protein [Desulfobacteraceae bacterium]|nr:MAG: radical SAM protein [Desulfobacteraceae bacterium]